MYHAKDTCVRVSVCVCVCACVCVCVCVRVQTYKCCRRPQVAEATIAMVKADYFAGTENKLVVLAWGGDARAVLKVETPGTLASLCSPICLKCADQDDTRISVPVPRLFHIFSGRLFETPKEDDEEASYDKIAPGVAMKMRGSNPRGCMLISPDPAVCPWADPEKAGHVSEFAYSDRIFVEYQGGDMAKCNMQLNIFSKDGIQYTAFPPSAPSGEQTSFWKVCQICHGDVLEQNQRITEDPSSGDIFAVRVVTARELENDDSPKPSPEVRDWRGDEMPP